MRCCFRFWFIIYGFEYLLMYVFCVYVQVGSGQLGVGGVPVSVGVPYMGGDGSVQYNGSTGIGPGGVCHYPTTIPSHLVDVDIETDSNHDTALTLACAGGHEELVHLLLTRGANIGKAASPSLSLE